MNWKDDRSERQHTRRMNDLGKYSKRYGVAESQIIHLQYNVYIEFSHEWLIILA